MNLSPSKQEKCFGVLCSLVFAVSAVILRIHFLSVSMILLLSLFILFATIVFGKLLNITVISFIVAVGISYCLFSLVMFITAPIVYAVGAVCAENPYFNFCSLLADGIIQHIVAVLVFTIKLFKHEMPFLLKRSASDVGVFLCVAIVLAIKQ